MQSKTQKWLIVLLLVLSICFVCTGCSNKSSPEKVAARFVESMWKGKISDCVDLTHKDLAASYNCTKKEFKQFLQESYDETMDMYDSFKLLDVQVLDSVVGSYITEGDAYYVDVMYTFSFRDEMNEKVVYDDYISLTLYKEHGKYLVVELL